MRRLWANNAFTSMVRPDGVRTPVLLVGTGGASAGAADAALGGSEEVVGVDPRPVMAPQADEMLDFTEAAIFLTATSPWSRLASLHRCFKRLTLLRVIRGMKSCPSTRLDTHSPARSCRLAPTHAGMATPMHRTRLLRD